jgi:tetratricopeptide (TPR) repeat protein/transglutaminase-like putative cysteine protease
MRCSFALVVLLSACATATAEGWPIQRGPSREPDPYHYDHRKPPVLPKDLVDDAVACVLYSGNTYLVEADGTIETTTHDVTRLMGRKGVEKVGEYRNITYDPSYQKLTLNEARIHKADGRIVPIESRHVQLRDVGTDYQVYDHEKQLIISFPSLEVGDVIEVKWTVRGKSPEHGGHFFTRYSFGDIQYPVLIDELRVRLPRERALKHAVLGGKLGPVVREDGPWRTYTWQSRNCRRMPQDDNLPSKEDLRVSVACSTFASWEEVAKWKQRLRADCWDCAPEVRKVVAEVTRGLSTQEAKARALTLWLRQKVRYISSGEKHDYTPHPPAEVLANRFGDCKDTSQLLAVMFREAGISVALVTLGAQDDGQIEESVPSPWGTHAILQATIDGRKHWVDTTSSLSGWDMLPRDDRNRLCYVVDDKGHLTLERTPPMAPDDYRIEQTTTVWVAPDGSSRCDRTAVYSGAAAAAQRDNFLEVPAGERRRLVTADLQDANSRTRLLHLDVAEAALRDLDQPVRLHMDFEVPGHFAGSPDREGSITDSKIWGRLLAYNLDYERTVALNLAVPCELHHRYVLHLPSAYALESVPRDREVRSQWGTFERTIQIGTGDDYARDFVVVFHLRIQKPIVEPSGFTEFRRFHEEVSQAYRVWLTLKPATDLNDAGPIESLLCLAPGDITSATILAKLYLKSDRPAEARRVLRRTLRHHPEEAGLWELLVQSATADNEREEAQRELVRRFPEEVKYALDLGATLVSQGKQDEARKLLTPLAQDGSPTQKAQAHYQLARSYYRRDEREKALEHLDAADKEDPETARTVRALLLRGNVLEELARPADAARAYEAAVKIDPNAELPLEGLVRLSLAIGNRARAVELLRRYTVAVGDDPAGLLLAADHHLRLERYEDAMDLAIRAGMKKHPAKAHRILGLVYWQRGDLAHAAEHLAKAEKDALVFDALLRIALARGQLDGLAACLDEAVKCRPSTLEQQQRVARARTLLNRRARVSKALPAAAGKEKSWQSGIDAWLCAEDARADGEARGRVEELVALALREAPELGPALALRGLQALESGRLNLALPDAEAAIRCCPKHAAGYYVRGRIRLERAQSEALADLVKAAELSERNDAEVLHSLAEALFLKGRLEEAVAAQRVAVRLRPKDPRMAEFLARLEKAH